jgi:hypothetical protein
MWENWKPSMHMGMWMVQSNLENCQWPSDLANPLSGVHTTEIPMHKCSCPFYLQWLKK